MTNNAAFAVTGLISRGGLSNWVFFFFPDRLVMVDVGMSPAIKAGVQVGVLGQLGVVGEAALINLDYGPSAAANQGVIDWCTALRAKAKNVVEMKADEIGAVQLRLRMLGHELVITGSDGTEKKFGLMNRKQAEATAAPLGQSFGPKFVKSKTPVFEFLERHAPFLL
jgi:hypothetical protein